MPRRFKEARLMNNLKAIEAAEKLGVAYPTLSAWESEKKSPPIDAIISMAKLYNVSVDYLVGNDVQPTVSALTPIEKGAISLYHGRPVWVEQHGWALVNSVEGTLVFADGNKMLYTDLNLLACAPMFAEANIPNSKLLSKDEIFHLESVWVEPISSDPLRNELRGMYTVKGEYVENSRGSRFFLDSYSATWLAFIKE